MKTNDLLHRYVDERSEPAFEELVGRHIDLVYSAALRQVNGNVPAAQDVTQAVFADLARKAPRLTQHPSLAGWLYTSTRYLAAKALRAERCRRSHEQEAHEMNELLQSTNSDGHWRELRPLLDDAMHDLSATDREAVLMRYFERLPLAEIGARTGLKENAVHMRIDRAIDRLRLALAKRGVTSAITALTAVLTGRAVGGAPAGLATQVSRAAYGAATAGGGLGWALLKLGGLTKTNLLIAVGGTALLAGLILVPQLLTKIKEAALSSEVSGATDEQSAAPSAPSVPTVAGADDPTSASKSMASDKLVLHIVAADTGKPIAGATVVSWAQEKDATNSSLTTNNADSLGVCAIPVSRDSIALLGVGTRTDGYVDTACVWFPKRGEKIPQQYTLRFENATPIGGQVLDENGNPVAGAAVTVWTYQNSAPGDDSSPPHISTEATENKFSDAEGRWTIARFSKKAILTLSLEVVHPDYMAETGFALKTDAEVEQPLLARAYIYKLHRGLSLNGIVVDADGQPVPGTKVTAISGGRPWVTTNQPDGTFTLSRLPAGPTQINAEARGFALATVSTEISTNQPPLRLELTRGNVLRLRVMDTNGMPVPNATVSLNPNRVAARARYGRNGSPGQFRMQTDADGRIIWDSAPKGGLIFGIHATGYEWAQNVQLTADGEEHAITLRAVRSISGTVLDGAVRQPISAFRVVTGEAGPPDSPTGTNFQWQDSQDFHDGTFRFDDDNPSAGAKIYKFEAIGYAPFVTRVVGADEGNASFDIALYPAAGTAITVVSPDGRPATNASIGLEMPGGRLNWGPAGFDTALPRARLNNVLPADDTGRVVLPPDDSVTRVIAASEDGYAVSTPGALTSQPIIRLQPWGRLEGILLSGGKPAAGRALRITYFENASFGRFRFSKVETDEDGHFAFAKLPSGRFNLFLIETREAIRGTISTFRPIQSAPVTVRSGETTSVTPVLYKVTARLSLPPGVQMETNWSMSAVANQTELVFGQQASEPLKKPGNGTWVAEDLPAGDYTLDASVVDLAPAAPDSKAHMQAMMSFTLPGNPPSGTLDLGEILLQPVQ
jgi:RNA polymerase sigma factor (sigma-70 family)